jgi:hypothetical protein
MNDGGPAFPFVSHGGIHEHQWCSGGMSLRDYFAAAALQSYALEYQERMSGEDIASQCYSLADAMLKQREKGV